MTGDQLVLIVTETEHISGSVPADAQEAVAQKQTFYAALQSQSDVPFTCLPDHGVHIYRWHEKSGACQCGKNKSTEGER